MGASVQVGGLGLKGQVRRARSACVDVVVVVVAEMAGWRVGVQVSAGHCGGGRVSRISGVSRASEVVTITRTSERSQPKVRFRPASQPGRTSPVARCTCRVVATYRGGRASKRLGSEHFGQVCVVEKKRKRKETNGAMGLLVADRRGRHGTDMSSTGRPAWPRPSVASNQLSPCMHTPVHSALRSPPLRCPSAMHLQ